MSKKNELLECQFRHLLDSLSTHEKHHLLNVTRKEIGVDISENVNGYNIDTFFCTKDKKTQKDDIKVEMKRVRLRIRCLKSEIGILKDRLLNIV